VQFQFPVNLAFSMGLLNNTQYGAVEKIRQRRSRHFSVLTYWNYALRAKMASALLDELF